jgi:hypothetical protein
MFRGCDLDGVAQARLVEHAVDHDLQVYGQRPRRLVEVQEHFIERD